VAIGCYSLTSQGTDARLERTDRIELDIDGELTPVPELVGTKRADVLVLNDDDLTYAKIRLDEDSLAQGLAHIDAFTESLPRSIVLASAWDMTRDGELAASRFLKAALPALGVEEHSSVIQGLLGRVATCLSGFLPPAVRHDLAQETADQLLTLVRAAQAGSDKQLQLVRALAAHAVTGEQLDVVTGLLEGSAVLDGLDVDQDLRWDLLTALVAADRYGEEQIRAEEAQDRTTTGRERAAEARAAVPTPEAKAATWRALVDDASMPNETQVRVLRGLTSVERRPELLVPFVSSYVEAIDSVWSSRTFHMAENLLTGLWSCCTVGLDGSDPATALKGWLESHAEAMCRAEVLYREGRLPKRICHCDTKVNNMLFDEAGGVLCVIDLDTVMPSFIFSDYGDFLRTAANATREDDPDIGHVSLRWDVVESFTKGYIEGTHHFLLPIERELLPFAMQLFPYMQCVRFLTDYINGDTYYKTTYPAHNLDRARNQYRLFELTLAGQDRLQHFIDTL